MVAILINVAFRGAALIRGEALITERPSYSMWIPKGTSLIRGRRLFEVPY